MDVGARRGESLDCPGTLWIVTMDERRLPNRLWEFETTLGRLVGAFFGTKIRELGNYAGSTREVPGKYPETMRDRY